MFCSRCGVEVPKEASFCPGCGEKLKIRQNANDFEKQFERTQNISKQDVMQDTQSGNMAAAAQVAVGEKANSGEYEGCKSYVDSHINKITHFSSVADLTKKRHCGHWIVWIWIFIACVYIAVDFLVMQYVDETWFSILSWIPFILFMYFGKRITFALERNRYIRPAYRDLSGNIQGNVDIDNLVEFLRASADSIVSGLHNWQVKDGVIRVWYGKRHSVVQISFSPGDRTGAVAAGQMTYYVSVVDAAGFFSLVTQIDSFVKVAPVIHGLMNYYAETIGRYDYVLSSMWK